MYGRVSDGHELMVSFDGVSQVFNTSLEDLNTVPVDLFSSVINQGRIRSLKSLTPEDKSHLSESCPLMNLDFKKHLGIKLDGPDKSNKYKKYKGHIDRFYRDYLNTEDFKKTFHHNGIGFHQLPPYKVKRTHYDSNTLRFKNSLDAIIKVIGFFLQSISVNRYNDFQGECKALFAEHLEDPVLATMIRERIKYLD